MATAAVDSAGGALYSEYVNQQWVRLLDLLEMNVRYERCLGSELFTADGRRILDFLSGYCVHNLGHNHPLVIAALREELGLNGPAMIRLTWRSGRASLHKCCAGARRAIGQGFLREFRK